MERNLHTMMSKITDKVKIRIKLNPKYYTEKDFEYYKKVSSNVEWMTDEEVNDNSKEEFIIIDI